SARPMQLGKLRWVAFGFVVLFFFVSVVLPAVMLIQVSFIRFIGLNVFDLNSYTLDNWRRMLTLRVNRLALTNSLVMSIVATTVGMIIYSLVSYVVTRSRYKGRHLLHLAAWVIQFTVSFSDLATVALLYGARSTVLPTLFLSQWSNGRLEEAAVAALMMTVVVLAVVVLVRRLVQGSVRTTTVA